MSEYSKILSEAIYDALDGVCSEYHISEDYFEDVVRVLTNWVIELHEKILEEKENEAD